MHQYLKPIAITVVVAVSLIAVGRTVVAIFDLASAGPRSSPHFSAADMAKEVPHIWRDPKRPPNEFCPPAPHVGAQGVWVFTPDGYWAWLWVAKNGGTPSN